jgi:hypothetical protein
VTRIQEQISKQVKVVQEHSIKWDLPEKGEPLVVVPISGKRCIAACGPGRCNCYPTVGHHYALVFESCLQQCSQEFLSEIGWLQNQVKSAEANVPLPQSAHGDAIDQLHSELRTEKTLKAG